MTHEFGASVILATMEGPETLTRLLARLKAQSVAPHLELVIAAPAAAVGALQSIEPDQLGAISVVQSDMTTTARARATAIRAARAPVVIFVEDHAFPVGDDWAERLIAAHEGPYAAVGPIMQNANPRTATSWASFMVEYAAWFRADAPGEADTVPGHNSSYKRGVLLEYGNEMTDILEAEWVLHRDLREKGHALWLDPHIVVEHMNFSRPEKAVVLQFLAGRMFAASRRRGWSPWRRLLFAGAAPLIFVRRVVRVTAQAERSPEARPHLWRAMPMMLLLLAASALGEGLGYAFGDGGRRGAYGRLEYERWRFVITDEAGMMASA